MKRILIALAFLFLPVLAHAQNCGAYPYTLMNGQTADASQVMANFNTIASCANNNLAHNGANSDITSLSGLTTPLTIGQGGTGNTTGQPSGTAGGSLAGTYPNPTFANAGSGTVVANITGGSTAPSNTAISAFSAQLTPCIGDTGSGGTVGAVPAPPAGSTANGAVLGASCTWVTQATTSPGMIIMYGAAGAPAGWLVCNGAAVSRTTYANLFAVIGTSFGSGDGSTTFNVPNFLGYFPRGANTTGAGPDAGRTFGSTQQDAFQGHYHGPLSPQTAMYGRYSGGATGIPSGTGATEPASTGSPVTDGTNGTPRTSTETRPVNVAVTFIIKTRLVLRPENDNTVRTHRIAA